MGIPLLMLTCAAQSSTPVTEENYGLAESEIETSDCMS